MRHHFLKIALICAVSLFNTAGAQNNQEAKLKAELEVVYNTWRQSIVRKNFEDWRKFTSAYRQMRVRNLAVSEKRAWPGSLFQHQISPPPLMSLRYVGTIVKGPTAASTYFGKIDLSNKQKIELKDNALVIQYTYERGGWKCDKTNVILLDNIPQVRERLRNQDKTVLQEQDGFHPPGVIPPVPKACPVPKYIAQVFADCPGRKVNITINNISTHEFENTREAQVISGGLKDGGNTIAISSTPLENPEVKGPMTVEVYIMPEIQGNVPGKPYTFTIPEDKQEPVHQTQTFTVTQQVLQSMNRAKANK